MFGSNKKEEVTLLIDIGNATVSGALVLYTKDKKPTLIYGTHLPFTIGQKPESDKLLSDLKLLLAQVLTFCIKNGMAQGYFKNKEKNIDSVLVSFSSPWFWTKIKESHLGQESAFIITQNFIENILDTEEKFFEREIKESKEGDVPKDKMVIIEKTITSSEVNGYKINDCIGQKTKFFDISIYLSLVPDQVLKIVSDGIYTTTHISPRRVHFHTFPLISFIVLRDLFPKESNFLIMDISGEVTDVTLVSGGAIKDTVSFPSGRNFLIRQIAKTCGVSAEIAESMLRMYNARTVDDQTLVQIEEIISVVEKEWSIYFENIFTELSKKNTVPNHIYLTSDNDITAIYSAFLKTPKMDDTMNFRKNVYTIPIDLNILKDHYIADSRFPDNEFIALLALFYAKGRS